jgi:hypothetical protein
MRRVGMQKHHAFFMIATLLAVTQVLVGLKVPPGATSVNILAALLGSFVGLFFGTAFAALVVAALFWIIVRTLRLRWGFVNYWTGTHIVVLLMVAIGRLVGSVR